MPVLVPVPVVVLAPTTTYSASAHSNASASATRYSAGAELMRYAARDLWIRLYLSRRKQQAALDLKTAPGYR
jgi:hypothetical protein